MSDEHTKSLHEELLSAFMHAAHNPREIAAANEIERLRKENAELKRKAQPERTVKPRKKAE